MTNRFFYSASKWQRQGLGLVRILVGAFLIYHGWEIIEKNKMNEYAKWMTDLHFPFPAWIAYLGKGAELISGICLFLGLFTRLMVIPLILTMMIICFGMGHGKIFNDDQYPFLFVLLGLVFFFNGPGKWSLDELLFSNENNAKRI